MTGAEIYSTVLTAAIGIVSFFLKKALSDLEKKADKNETERIEKELNTVKKSIDDVKDNYLTREDFFREQLKTEKKLDRIMDMLVEMRGGLSRE